MLRTLPNVIALGLVISTGLVHGQWTHRWTPSHAIKVAAGRIRHLPMTLGDWQGEAMQLDREQLDLAEIDGYVARRYVDRITKASVTLLLVCGSPGPISVHTPDVCYSAAGFGLLGRPERYSLPNEPSSPPAEFQSALFGKTNTPVPTYLRILWSWTSGKAWEVPENPRLAFASKDVLHKLYVIRELSAADERSEDDPTPAFLRILLSEMQRTVL